MSNHSFPNVIQPNLGDEWSKRAGELTSFFQDVGLPPGQHSQALYILPVRPRDADSYVDALRIKTWVFLTGTAGDAKTPLVIAFPINTRFKLGKTADALQKSTLALYVEIHSRLITWWLVNAWRSQQLADAAWSLCDAFQIVPAAAPTPVAMNLLVNRDASPFNDPDIRRAMQLTIDRKSFLDIIAEGQGDINGAMQSPPAGLWGLPPEILTTLPGYSPDVAQNRAEARKLMEQHGYSSDPPS